MVTREGREEVGKLCNNSGEQVPGLDSFVEVSGRGRDGY